MPEDPDETLGVADPIRGGRSSAGSRTGEQGANPSGRRAAASRQRERARARSSIRGVSSRSVTSWVRPSVGVGAPKARVGGFRAPALPADRPASRAGRRNPARCHGARRSPAGRRARPASVAVGPSPFRLPPRKVGRLPRKRPNPLTAFGQIAYYSDYSSQVSPRGGRPHVRITERGACQAPATDLESLIGREYEQGFVTEIESETLPPGIDEEVVARVSEIKGEPGFMREWRLEAYRRWREMREPNWASLAIAPIDYQAISYYSAPKSEEDAPKSLDEVDPKLLETYEKLGIPLEERAVPWPGWRWTPCSTASRSRPRSRSGWRRRESSSARSPRRSGATPEIVREYLGSVVPRSDNFFAALNSAVFTDGSFVYVPKGVRCPMELSTYFRINAANTGQFERTLVVADEGSYVSYLEGCTAPMRDENQLHAAVVELVALEGGDDQVLDGPRTGTRATRTGWGGSTTSSPSAATAAATGPRSRGPRSRPAPRSPGSIRAASSEGRRLGRGVLLRRGHPPSPAGRHRHEDDPPRPQHPQQHRLQGHLGRPEPQRVPRSRAGRARREPAPATTPSATRS